MLQNLSFKLSLNRVKIQFINKQLQHLKIQHMLENENHENNPYLMEEIILLQKIVFLYININF